MVPDQLAGRLASCGAGGWVVRPAQPASDSSALASRAAGVDRRIRGVSAHLMGVADSVSAGNALMLRLECQPGMSAGAPMGECLCACLARLGCELALCFAVSLHRAGSRPGRRPNFCWAKSLDQKALL